jgi:hypothetical protein
MIAMPARCKKMFSSFRKDPCVLRSIAQAHSHEKRLYGAAAQKAPSKLQQII